MKTMTLAEFDARVTAFLENVKADNDPEELHIEEDTIVEIALRAIVDGKGNPTRWATLALKAVDSEYTRWYA